MYISQECCKLQDTHPVCQMDCQIPHHVLNIAILSVAQSCCMGLNTEAEPMRPCTCKRLLQELLQELRTAKTKCSANSNAQSCLDAACCEVAMFTDGGCNSKQISLQPCCDSNCLRNRSDMGLEVWRSWQAKQVGPPVKTQKSLQKCGGGGS